ncbi:hypothetical protein [Cohnella panacarvi]|uniref:hypothetical protein n=1 Tax=Cohnella panacarvi TaxID=400776 RepID=UPI00047C930E|nr:hypothetical protein [Cohnella panacarvi]
MLTTVRYKFGKMALAFMMAASLLVAAIPASAEISGATNITNLQVSYTDDTHRQIVATSRAVSTRPKRTTMKMINFVTSIDPYGPDDRTVISDSDMDGIIDWTSKRYRADRGYRIKSSIDVSYLNGLNDFFIRDYFWDPKNEIEPKVSKPFRQSLSLNPTKAIGYFEYANASKTNVVAKVAASTTRTNYEYIYFSAKVSEKGFGQTDGVSLVIPNGDTSIEWESLLHNGDIEMDLEYSFSLRFKDGKYDVVMGTRKWSPVY